MQSYRIKTINIIALVSRVFLLLIFFSCNGNQVKKSENVKFAIISNTHAESPYVKLDQRMLSALKQIREENPVLLMHLGGMICGGAEWSGITKDDIERQYKEFNSSIAGLFPIFYTAKSSSDLLNSSSDYYYNYTNRKDYYSFNYGTLHFLVLDSTRDSISKEQMEWMINDLLRYKNSAAIFVFVNKPLFIPEKIKLQGFKTNGFTENKNNEILHKYFLKYSVKAVLSGSYPQYFKSVIDSISYINAGCGGFNKDEIFKGYVQYYIAEYNNEVLLIHPGYISARNK